MSGGRIVSWIVVVLFALTPLNWIRLWIVGDIPKDATLSSFLIGVVVCWGIAGALGYFLVMSARGIKIGKAREERALQELLSRPLSEIRPRQALIKPDEKAYAAARGNLQEMKTVGYASGTSGVSVRVAKGVTLRSGGTRGGAIKDMVSVASGELVITDKRVIFAGDRKSFVVALGDLVNTTDYADGFGFSDGKATYTVITESESERIAFGITMGKLLRA